MIVLAISFWQPIASIDTHGLTPVALKAKSQLHRHLAFVHSFLEPKSTTTFSMNPLGAPNKTCRT
jgi:hypothetical protein